MPACYYEILEIEKTSDESDIKKAYRRMALRWHPDKNPGNKEEAEAKFKEISEAYEVLSDKSKRVIYDKYGKEGLVNGGSGYEDRSSMNSRSHVHHFAGSGFSFHFRDPLDVFRDFFGGRDPFADFFGGGLLGGMLDPFGGFDALGAFGDPFPFGGSNMISISQHNPQRRVSRGGQSNHRVQPYERQQQPHRSQHHQLQIPTRQNIFGAPMMGMSLFNSPLMAQSGFASSMSPFGFAMNGGGANFTSTSSSVKIVNGNRIVTKKVVQNGTETVTVEENGRITSKTVNGVPQRV